MKFDLPTADEMPLVYDAWARSFKKSPWAGCIRNCDYDQVSRSTIEEILNRGARVVVAVQELDEGGRRVMGYSVSEPELGVLHWLFVKKAFRGMGIGRALLSETVRNFPARTPLYTHRTLASSGFLGEGWKHDPAPARVKS